MASNTWKFWLIAVISIVLVACGGNNASGEGTESDSSSDEINLKFVHWINEENGNWEEVISQYEKENPGINIESEALVENMNFQDYLKQLDLMASAGESFDMMMFANPAEYGKRIQSQMVAPINEFMEEEGIQIEEVYNNTYAPVDEEYYGLPMKNTAFVIMMNKNHLEEAGLEIPTEWTWEEYREFANKLTTEDRYGSYLHIWHDQHSSLKLMGKPEDSSFLKDDGSSNVKDPLMRESFELRYQLEQKDKTSVPLSEILSQKMDYRQQFFTESVSMLPIGSYMLTEWGQFTPEFEIAWAPWPKNEKNGDAHVRMGGDVIAVSESSEHKQAAYDFIRWMSTEGISEQGVWLPSWKESDLDSVLKTLAENTSKPEANDLESFKTAITNVKGSKAVAPAPYYTEAFTEFEAEVELYLLGEEEIDATIENLDERIHKVIETNE